MKKQNIIWWTIKDEYKYKYIYFERYEQMQMTTQTLVTHCCWTDKKSDIGTKVHANKFIKLVKKMQKSSIDHMMKQYPVKFINEKVQECCFQGAFAKQEEHKKVKLGM